MGGSRVPRSQPKDDAPPPSAFNPPLKKQLIMLGDYCTNLVKSVVPYLSGSQIYLVANKGCVGILPGILHVPASQARPMWW